MSFVLTLCLSLPGLFASPALILGFYYYFFKVGFYVFGTEDIKNVAQFLWKYFGNAKMKMVSMYISIMEINMVVKMVYIEKNGFYQESKKKLNKGILRQVTFYY